jgi:hypothetical protein
MFCRLLETRHGSCHFMNIQIWKLRMMQAVTKHALPKFPLGSSFLADVVIERSSVFDRVGVAATGPGARSAHKATGLPSMQLSGAASSSLARAATATRVRALPLFSEDTLTTIALSAQALQSVSA